MGVYIKGMEMPKSCSSCKIKRRNGEKMVCPLCDEEWDIRDPMSADHRLDNCPLVPVPAHGRLGDMDEIVRYKERLVVDADKINPAIRYVVDTKYIDGTPTIIPAEEG